MRDDIFNEIVLELGENYVSDDENVIKSILNDVINDALFISNRRVESQTNLSILKSDIKKAVKTIYLQRGTDDVSNISTAGTSSTFVNAIEVMKNDIIRENKRIFN